MSATSEALLEQIKSLEENIQVEESSGRDASSLRKQLVELKKSFNTATSTLNEGKSILKG